MSELMKRKIKSTIIITLIAIVLSIYCAYKMEDFTIYPYISVLLSYVVVLFLYWSDEVL